MSWTKISAKIQRVYCFNRLNLAENVSPPSKLDFIKLIPNSTKRTARNIERSISIQDDKHIVLRDGTRENLNVFRHQQLRKHRRIACEHDANDLQNERPVAFLRKLKLESAVHMELVSIFSCDSLPKILQMSQSLWSITKVIAFGNVV